jgi:hypothetical protein
MGIQADRDPVRTFDVKISLRKLGEEFTVPHPNHSILRWLDQRRRLQQAGSDPIYNDKRII